MVKFAACTYIGPMCNLHSLNKGQAAIRQVARAMRDTVGNLPLMLGVFPDYPAPIVRHGADGERELVLGALGYSRPAPVWWGARHQHPQCQKPALARMAQAREPVRRALYIVL